MASEIPEVRPVVAEVTERIRERSRSGRADYLARMEAARRRGSTREGLSCTNLAHGFAASDATDKEALKRLQWPNVAIVSAYNDMLSAHQPLERFPALIKMAAREVGAVAQFAGGVPAALRLHDDGHIAGCRVASGGSDRRLRERRRGGRPDARSYQGAGEQHRAGSAPACIRCCWHWWC